MLMLLLKKLKDEADNLGNDLEEPARRPRAGCCYQRSHQLMEYRSGQHLQPCMQPPNQPPTVHAVPAPTYACNQLFIHVEFKSLSLAER